MAIGVLGLGFSFYSAPKTIEQAKAMIADSHSDGHHEADTHNSEEATHANVDLHDSSEVHQEEDAHSPSHDEHLLHYLQNRPWSALYVA
ncbi:MAG: quinol:cytochrome C oxidoreductase, partial [Flavobacteriaceae bacterium]|nr:quinol:cytochrome C oxidoreductase [Flavobacteriaceae bacterium]